MNAAAVDLRPSNRWLYAGIAALIAASVGVQIVRDRVWTPFVPPNPAMWLQSGKVADKVFLGYKSLVADVYWMRAVVYYGSKRKEHEDTREQGLESNANYDLLYPLLDLATTLDPHFTVAYRMGAIFLSEAYPSGPGRPDLGVSLLQRGIEKDNGRWEYMEDIGFVYYWWVKDYKKASEWFARAGQAPGAASWLAPLAATTLAEGGDRQSSRLLWTQLANSDLEWIRKDAVWRLQQLDAMDQIDDFNARIKAFIDREGKRPTDWRQVGVAVAPVDPTGTPYRINKQTGLIDLGPGSKLFPLPR
jgi:hypothetical protein